MVKATVVDADTLAQGAASGSGISSEDVLATAATFPAGMSRIEVAADLAGVGDQVVTRDIGANAKE